MNEALSVIAENLSQESQTLSRLYARFPLYLEDICHELLERSATVVGDEELALSYRQLKDALTELLLQKQTPTDEQDLFTKDLLASFEPILAAKLARTVTQNVQIDRYLPFFEATAARIAYFRNAYSDLAYRRFAKELTEPTVIYRENFAAVCEELYADRCDLAILPVESSRDGKLSVIEKLVTQYELSPVLYCTVPTTDEGTLRFGLFASAPMIPRPSDLIELILFSDEQGKLTRLLASADDLNITLKDIALLPPAQGFRHEWKLTFGGKEEDLDAFWVLLHCEYPHHLLCGICRELI